MSDHFDKSLKVAVLQTGRSPEALRGVHGDYDDMCKTLLGREATEADTFAILDGEFPASLDPYDVLLITGSRHGVYEGHDWIPPLEDLVRKADKAKKTMIGICFGHQIIAQALGAKVAKSDKGFGVGVMEYELKVEDEASETIALCAWHQDQVLSVPDGAEIIASSEFCPIAGLRYGDHAISFQPHPEFTRDYVAKLVKVRREGGTLNAEIAEKAEISLAQETDTLVIQKLLAEFIGERVASADVPV